MNLTLASRGGAAYDARDSKMAAPMRQADLFDTQEEAPVLFRADPAKVRVKLLRILDEARAAETMPWSEERLGYHQTVFPQMCRWLPDEEARQLCFAFEAEIERLKVA